ncbi:MAG: 4'-phosphopantetheinyl transferase superfamily protein [Thermoguttaceae bacterium]|jgi:4'-phosphopantetheinyl transferase
MTEPNILWPPGPTSFRLSPGEIHLWCTLLDLPPEATRQLASVLSEDERDRAARFGRELLRTRFVAARGTLRSLLGRCLGAPAEEIQICYGGHGKPALAAPWDAAGIHFNMAHSRNLAVFALSGGLDLGVDVEWVRPMRNMWQLVERYFSPQEQQQWRQMDDAQRQIAFFRGWTRKEAWLKGLGTGLTFPLEDFTVSLDEPARLLAIRGDADQAARWWLESGVPAENALAAVACLGRPTAVARWAWPDFLSPSPPAGEGRGEGRIGQNRS